MSDVNEVVTPVTETPVTPVATPEPVTLADDALLPLKINGEDKMVPWREARQGFQLHGDYTRKMQSLADERKAFESERQSLTSGQSQLQEQLSQLKAVMNNPQALSALYMTLASRTNAASAEPKALTTAELPQLTQSLEQRFQKQLEQFQQTQTQQAQEKQIEDAFFSHTRGLLTKYPMLNVVEGLDRLVEKKVMAMSPKSLDEAKVYANTVIDGIARKQADARTEGDKQALLARQAANGIEPRGGSAVLPKPQSFKNAGEREAAMIAMLEQLVP